METVNAIFTEFRLNEHLSELSLMFTNKTLVSVSKEVEEGFFSIYVYSQGKDILDDRDIHENQIENYINAQGDKVERFKMF